jgi:hypothetical protein
MFWFSLLTRRNGAGCRHQTYRFRPGLEMHTGVFWVRTGDKWRRYKQVRGSEGKAVRGMAQRASGVTPNR